jgi:prepilin-type N-terminal cleavage/methylation domain-containing protein
MTTTPVHSEAPTAARPGRIRRKGGFTLAEMMIATAIGAIAVAALTGSFLFFVRSSLSMGNYALLNARGRTVLEEVGRDLRMAHTVRTMDKGRLVVEVGRASGETIVEYYYDSNERRLLRIDETTRRVLLRDVDQFEFRYFNIRGGPAGNTLEAKRVQLDARLRRDVQATQNTMRIISASFTMRNRHVVN